MPICFAPFRGGAWCLEVVMFMLWRQVSAVEYMLGISIGLFLLISCFSFSSSVFSSFIFFFIPSVVYVVGWSFLLAMA